LRPWQARQLSEEIAASLGVFRELALGGGGLSVVVPEPVEEVAMAPTGSQ
jgi:hypothetical protein